MNTEQQLPTQYHARFRWTEADWHHAHRADWIDRSGIFRWGCHVTGTLGILCGFLDRVILGSQFWYLYLVVGVPLVLIAPFQWRLAVGRSYQRIPERDREARWSFDHDRVECWVEGVVEAVYHWRLFERCLVTPNGCLLYQEGGQVFHWFPRTSFATEEQAEYFGRFAQGRIVEARAGLVTDVSAPGSSTPDSSTPDSSKAGDGETELHTA